MDNFTLVIFGITSNLAQIKLIPTLYDLVAGDRVGTNFSIVGIGRTNMDQAGFKDFVSRTLRTPNRHHTHPIDPAIETKLLDHATYLSADLTDPKSYEQLRSLIGNSPTSQNRMYYLATFPSLFTAILENLKHAGLTEAKDGWTRLLIEKPIGTDRSSANNLNTLLTGYFTEKQIFRLDHYLGKETLQNILTFRFGNGMLEPLMNSEHIDHIQVTATEDFGIGLRGPYYDQNGALKDVGQNHLLQMIALTTMDAPVAFTNSDVTEKRVDILRNLTPEPDSLVIGQYEDYHAEHAVAPDSDTETFFAFRTHIAKPRFADIPIYVRAGKYLTRTATEVAIVFENHSPRIFSHLESGLDPNILIYRIQPNEGIVLKMVTKKPGHELKLEESYMQFCYPQVADLPDAYERLIVDALRGDQTFFNDANEVDAQWAFTDPLIAAKRDKQLIVYPRGSWGPKEVDELMEKDGHCWYEPSTAFCRI